MDMLALYLSGLSILWYTSRATVHARGIKDPTTTSPLRSFVVADALNGEVCEKPTDPFLWVSATYEMKNVVSVCDFYRDFFYRCNITNSPSPVREDSGEEGSGTATNSEAPPLLEMTVKMEGSLAVISLRCNMTRVRKQMFLDANGPTRDAQKHWDYSDGIMISDSAEIETGYPILAKCYFKTHEYECFGVPVCETECSGPCSGGEPWRGSYRIDDDGIIRGNITNMAQSAAGEPSDSENSASAPANPTDDVSQCPNSIRSERRRGLGVFQICPEESAEGHEKCSRYKAQFVQCPGKQTAEEARVCEKSLSLFSTTSGLFGSSKPGE